jgi:hypothetical protein
MPTGELPRHLAKLSRPRETRENPKTRRVGRGLNYDARAADVRKWQCARLAGHRASGPLIGVLRPFAGKICNSQGLIGRIGLDAARAAGI